jgi:hypothetical protein
MLIEEYLDRIFIGDLDPQGLHIIWDMPSITSTSLCETLRLYLKCMTK